MAWTVVLFVVGIALLIGGAELLVRGASRLATGLGIPPLVVGLTVVAFGTSSPELAVSVQSAMDGEADLALGNVVGSNIFNVLFILGLSAVIAPLVVAGQLVRLEVPIMIGASLVVIAMGLDGAIGRGEAALLAAGVVTYTTFLIARARRDGAPASDGPASDAGAHGPAWWATNAALVIVGLGLLVLGSRWLVGGAVVLATAIGVSSLVIGLTVVAAGTSLPEVATSILASVRGERDIAVGNVVGSNIFNLLAVLGFAGLVAPAPIPVPPGALTFDLPVMTAVAVACLPIFFTGCSISRAEGTLFLAYYVAYTVFLFLAAAEHDALPAFASAMTWFVLPLTAITLGVVSAREWRRRRRRRAGAPP